MNNLKIILKNKKVSMSELARKLGVTRQAVFQYAGSKNITICIAKKIAEVLEIDWKDIYE